MLKKFVNIKNISRFKSFNASGDVELKRHSLLYGENGRGKTTVCAILRSLQTGVGAHVIGRTMLGSTDAPGIRILSDDLTLIFSNGAWNSTLPDIAIFDSTFITENVFSGDFVDIGHKRKLYRVIVGRDGVALAKAIESFDDASRTKAAEIREKATLIQAVHLRGMTLETSLGLERDPEIDEKSELKSASLKRSGKPNRSGPGLHSLRLRCRLYLSEFPSCSAEPSRALLKTQKHRSRPRSRLTRCTITGKHGSLKALATYEMTDVPSAIRRWRRPPS